MKNKKWIIKFFTKRRSNFIIFLFVFSMPFISVAHTIGTDVFLDSFENSEHYYLLEKDDKKIIVQTSDAPGFSIDSGETMLFYSEDGELSYGKINRISSICGTRVYTIQNDVEQMISEQSIIGKIVKQTDNNFLNSISMNLWDISVHNLNINALVAD